ncbi:MAG: toprim domain-containing protein [Nanoarchaeota archaeon]
MKTITTDHHRSEIRSLLEKLALKERSILIVEGKRDSFTLKRLLPGAEIFSLANQKRSLYESAEHIASNFNEAILMLDADQKGKELSKKIIAYLQSLGVKVNKDGEKLLKLANRRHIEDLRSVII